MVLKNENGTIKAGLILIFLFFSIFGIWMATAPLNSAAVAPGKVGVVDNKKIIQHLEGGVIEKIYVNDGDIVKAQDPLIVIKNVRLNSEIEITMSEYLQTSTTVSRLEAQKNGDSKITFSDDISNIIGAQTIKKSQIIIFEEQKKLLNDEISILKQRITQLESQIAGTKAILKAKEKRLISISEEIKEWDRLFKEKLSDKIRLRDLQREQTSIEADIAVNKAEISRLMVQISETKSQIIVRERSFKEDVLKNLEVARKRLFDLKETYKALKDQSERAIIRAPVDGSIVELSYHTIGGVVRSGDRIMSIIPSKTDYIIEAKLSIPDIDTVHVGLNADLRFSAFNSKQSKVIQGKVTYISADSLKDERGFPYYELKAIVLPEGIEELKDNDFFLLPGMPVEVMVKTGERTMLDYVLKPFIDMFQRAFNED